MWGQWDAGDEIVADFSDLKNERFSDYINSFNYTLSSYKGPPLKVKFLETNNDLRESF